MKEEKYWVLLSKKLAGEATPAELEELREMLLNHPEWVANVQSGAYREWVAANYGAR